MKFLYSLGYNIRFLWNNEERQCDEEYDEKLAELFCCVENLLQADYSRRSRNSEDFDRKKHMLCEWEVNKNEVSKLAKDSLTE